MRQQWILKFTKKTSSSDGSQVTQEEDDSFISNYVCKKGWNYIFKYKS